MRPSLTPSSSSHWSNTALSMKSRIAWPPVSSSRPVPCVSYSVSILDELRNVDLGVYFRSLCVPQERQGKVRVPVSRAPCHNAIKQLRVVLCQSEGLGTARRATFVIAVLRSTVVVGLDNRPSRRREEGDRVVDPGENLVLVMQVRDVNPVLTLAVVVVRSSVSAVSPATAYPPFRFSTSASSSIVPAMPPFPEKNGKFVHSQMNWLTSTYQQRGTCRCTRILRAARLRKRHSRRSCKTPCRSLHKMPLC